VQSNHFNAFVSENYPVLAEAGVSIEYNKHALQNNVSGNSLKLLDALSPDIAIIPVFPGIQEKNFQAIFRIPGLKGVILETYGSGNVPNELWLRNCLAKAVKSGILIFNVSQCIGGKVIQGKYQTSRLLNDVGVISGGNITVEAAVAKLMFILGNDSYSKEPHRYLSTALRGEMDQDNALINVL
jgi:L-asparaginase